MRVLLVEDDPMLRDGVARGLRSAGHAVDVAEDGGVAVDKTSHTDYDVVVLDRDLPVIHGDDVCRHLVARNDATRVLMLTAFGEVHDRVDGLRLGADDYLTKPFAMSELLARIDALGRRLAERSDPVLRFADLELDPAAHRATRAGRTLELTPKEFGVLRELLASSPNVCSAEHLLERVWDDRADPFTNAVRVTMTTLRKKLGDPPLIETIVGTGYVIR